MVAVRSLVVFVLLVAAACGEDKAGGGGGGMSAVLAAWKAEGLDPSGFEEIAGEELKLAGGKCRAGALDGVDTTLCEFADPDAAQKAQPGGLALVGAATGTSLPRGRLLLVLIDRKNADPNGKRINKIAQAYRHAK